jgi:hypothetical protein
MITYDQLAAETAKRLIFFAQFKKEFNNSLEATKNGGVMRRPATALLAIVCSVLLSCSTLFASDLDPLKSLTSSVSQFKSGVDNSIQRISASSAPFVSGSRDLLGQAARAPYTAAGVIRATINSNIFGAVNSVNESVRKPRTGLRAQWNYYNYQFGIAGAPLFAIGQITNPIIERATGIKPGSPAAREAGKTINSQTGGLFNVPIKVIWGRDLNNPGRKLEGLQRINALAH